MAARALPLLVVVAHPLRVSPLVLALDLGDDLGEAKVHYKLALEKPAVAYQANLGMGQLLVREKQYTEAMPYIERALSLKTGDKASLEQYISRVRRAADRENQRKEREAKERAEADEAAKKPK